MKSLFTSNADKYDALLSVSFNSSVMWIFTKSTMLLSRLIRSSVPTDNAALKPQEVGEHFEEKDEMAKLRNAHSGKNLPSLQPGQEVYVPDRGTIRTCERTNTPQVICCFYSIW